MLAQLSVIYVSYSIVTTGLITVFVWDALSFDRRDAHGDWPLPLTGPTIIAAKLAALVTFLLARRSQSIQRWRAVRADHGARRRSDDRSSPGWLSAGTLGGAGFVSRPSWRRGV